MFDRTLGAYMAFCIALVAAVAAHWGRVRLVDVVPIPHARELVYSLAMRAGPALALVAGSVFIALLVSPRARGDTSRPERQ